MEANNTSCFNYRYVDGTTKLSNHSYGTAIDINPLYNPYVKEYSDGTIKILPSAATAYADRSIIDDYMIDHNDYAYLVFTSYGFSWGGDWNSVKDYQHFEKN